MCPEKQTLSAYFDGELEEPFKAVVEEHSKHCSRCCHTLASFSDIRSGLFLGEEDVDYEAGKRRVWANIQDNIQRDAPYPTFWKRRVPVPMPAFIGFTLIIFLFLGGFILVLQRQSHYNNQMMTASTIRRIQEGMLEKELEMVTKYFEAQDDVIEVNMELPKKSRFIVGGEPRLIRVDEFNELKQ